MDVGDVAKITATFKVAGVLTDPGTVAITIRPPTASEYSRTYPSNITRVSEGVYATNIPCTEVGRWYYQWLSTGAGAGANTGYFQVLNDAL